MSIGLDLNLGTLLDRQSIEYKDLGSKLILATIYGTNCDDKQDPASQVSDLHSFPLPHLPHQLMTMALHYH